MAAIASVTFTSAGTATLGAAAFTFSMQQAAAAEQIDTTASSNTETAVSVEASGDKKASDDEESEEVEAEEELLEPDSTPIASVGSGGAAGNSTSFDTLDGGENVGNLANASQQQAGAQSVSPSASLPSDDLGFTTNSYAGSIAEALADVESPSVPAAIATELALATPAKPTSSESSSSSNGNDAPLASGSFAPMGTSSWFGSYASNSSAPVSQGLSSSDLPITLLGDAGASSGTSSLNNASLKLVDFTSASVNAAKAQGWEFSDASIATESGVYTTTAPWVAITNNDAWTTTTVEGTTNRTYYAALMTVKVSSLSTSGGVLLTSTATSTGTKTNDMREGIGYDYTGGVYKVESAWVGNQRGDGLINQDLSSFADANGLVTVAIIYKGNDSQQAQGVTIFVADQTKDDTGLKGADAPGGNPRMFLADAAGVQYTNLYLFGMENGTAITNADMQSMMKEAGSYYWVGGENDNAWDATSKNWTHYGSDVAVAIGNNGGNANTNVVFTTQENTTQVTLAQDTTIGSITLESGAAVTLDTDAFDLTAKELVTNGGSLTKTGTGTATFGEAGAGNNVTLHTLQVDEGTVEFNQHVIVDRNRINVAYAVKDAKTGVSAVFNDGLDFTGTDSKNYSMVVGFENTVVLGGESNLGDNKVVGIARNGTLELQDGAKASVGSVLNSSTPDNNGTLKLGKGAIFNITNANSSSTLTNIENKGGTLNVSGGLTVHSAVSGDGKIVYNGPAGKTMQLNGGGEMGKITVTSGDFVTTGAQGITLGGLDVQGGTAHVGNSGAVDLGDVNLTGGKLVLNTTVSAESLTTTSGATLTFAGIGDKILTTSGNINLGSGTTFDLSNITYRTDVAQQTITLATSNGDISLAEGENVYAFTNPKTTGAKFSLDTQGNNLVLVVDQTISPWEGGNVRYTYTVGQDKHVTYESDHGYDFSAADGGVVEFKPDLFNNETHTYTDLTAREMPLHANTTFVVEEGNTVILGAQVIGNDNEDGGDSGSFTKDGGGILVMALNSGVFSPTVQGKTVDYNHYEGDVIVKEGTLHILAHSQMDEAVLKTSMLAGREDATVTVNKDATLILDPSTGILMPYGNENPGEVNNTFTLQAAEEGDTVTTLTNLLLDKSGLRPVDARDGARANVTDAWTFTIADSRTLQDAMTITAADITVIGEMGLEGNFTIDNTHITATGDCDINEQAVVFQGKNPTAVLRNGSIIEFSGEETWTMARVWNSDVDKTSKINFFGKDLEENIAGYLSGNNKIEVASTENGGVAERKIETGEDLITTIDYTTDQYKGMILYDAGEGYPLSFAVTLSDTDLPEDLSNSEFYLTFTDLDSSALLTNEFVDVRDIMDVSLVIPQYTGGEWEELVAAVYAKFDGVDTVFWFQHVTPEPTTSTLSLLALAALAARRRRRK